MTGDTTIHDNGEGRHDNGKGQNCDGRHDDGNGRHNDGKGQQGDGQHNDGDGQYDNLVQPLDIGYNKPFKTRICAAWEEYMIIGICKNGSFLSPSRKEASHWISGAYWSQEGSPIVKNVWLKTG